MYKLFRMMRFIIPLVVFLLLAVFFWVGLGKDPRVVPSAMLNQPMPEFSLPALKDSQLTLNRELFMGHVSVLHVWASWCHTCQSEHPFWVDVAKDTKVGVYGLLFKDARFSAKHWLDAHGNPYHFCIFDEDGNLAMDLGVYQTPATFIVDKRGVIRYKHVGAINEKVWDQEFMPRISHLQRSI